MLSLLATITLLVAASGASALPPAYFSSSKPDQILLSPAEPKLKDPNKPATDASQIPLSDTIICPSTEAIIPIYGLPSQHHSYTTAVNTFCRSDLMHIPHGTPHTHSAAPPSDNLAEEIVSTGILPSTVTITPKAPLSRSYRVTLIADSVDDATPATSSSHGSFGAAFAAAAAAALKATVPKTKTHTPDAHQLSLEIRNDNDHTIQVSSEDCIASFMAIVDAAAGCRVSDALTKTGEYHVGRNNERDLGGVVFRATQWK